MRRFSLSSMLQLVIVYLVAFSAIQSVRFWNRWLNCISVRPVFRLCRKTFSAISRRSSQFHAALSNCYGPRRTSNSAGALASLKNWFFAPMIPFEFHFTNSSRQLALFNQSPTIHFFLAVPCSHRGASCCLTLPKNSLGIFSQIDNLGPEASYYILRMRQIVSHLF